MSPVLASLPRRLPALLSFLPFLFWLCSCKGHSLLQERPYGLVLPAGHEPAQPVPLVLFLHGYGGNPDTTRKYSHLDTLAERHGFIAALPSGTADFTGQRFWNATDACCNFYGSRVDDVAYLSAVIEDISARHRIDRKRVYVVGHSNGGFMASRLACDRADLVAAIVNVAGADWRDPARCQPREKVAVLHVHGDADQTVRYEGGDLHALAIAPRTPPAPYPSARDSVGTWLARNRCSPTPDSTQMQPGLDSQASETRIERWHSCQGGGAVELWTLHGAGHNPGDTPLFEEQCWAFLAAQHKP